MDAIYGCDTCRSTIGRAGCPTHRDSNAYTDEAGAYHYTGSRLVMTHCVHGLDLRLHPRCYLCRPEQPAPDALRAAAQAVVEALFGCTDSKVREAITDLRAALGDER